MVRIHGRPLKGAEIRDLDNKLRNQGLKREVYRAVQRGDSPTAINKLFKQAGYNVGRLGAADYIGRTYKSKTSVAYFDKLEARYGSRSKINVETFRRAGWGGKLQFTVSGKDRAGKTTYRTIEVDGSKYEAIGDLTDDIYEGLLDGWLDDYFDVETLEIVSYRFF